MKRDNFFRNPCARLLGSVFAALSLIVFLGAAPANLVEFRIDSNRDFKRVEKAMNASDAAAVLVTIAAGEYKLKDSFHINRSNVALKGEGQVTLRLANGAQRPVVAVGSQRDYPLDEERIHGIRISDLSIDGNREKQRSEYDRKLPWIRNNGIDVRVVTDLVVERVTSNSNRSGGLVISWRCRDILVRDCVFEDNYFDGVAYYDSAKVFTVDCVMRNNLGAGISLDNAFVDSLFMGCELLGNHDVGVFARHSERLVFFQCRIEDSGNWAFFLAHDENERGVFDTDIASCSLARNNGGVRIGSVTEQQSSRNRLLLARFEANDASGRKDVSTAGSTLRLVNEAWSSTGEAELAVDDVTRDPVYDRVYQAISSFHELSGG
ncbi:right-handed parallel beta-helix repeat-containing protein [Pelagicoccus sp. SDUM812003]|uniref:right-handed parallel beta-helix repeat-containing protein n=1 Tax=Pelagicoccus sp. SDUM812003 TaxID=3041267 RepID=UPI00280F6BF6|nr:right-handed parallel beta-helix repeat-containing protein [Pelagicoccus sp. SDUM812003]MDQ8202689.1 right-handed parallel beta-helix repeat-containing protein [Pelagicoccus sp. SDUM812003]